MIWPGTLTTESKTLKMPSANLPSASVIYVLLHRRILRTPNNTIQAAKQRGNVSILSQFQSSSMAAARGAKGRKGRSGTKKISGVDFTWDPDLDDNKPAPAPLFPVS